MSAREPALSTGPENPKSIRRILLVRTDRLGDVVLTLPMLPFLRTRYPDAYIALLLNRYTGEIVEGNPYVNELIWYDHGSGLIPFAKMCRIIDDRHFDAVVVVHPTPRLAWLMFRTGIPERIGTGYRYYSFLFNRKVFEHRKNAKRHEVEYNLSLLKELDCVADGKPEFYINIPAAAESRVHELLTSLNVDASRKMVIIHPGSGGSARDWPAESFGLLAMQLGNDQANQIIVTGQEHDAKQVEQVVRSAGGNTVPIVGKLHLKELTALIKSASLFVSNSTGPLHIAVAVGTPVLGFYPQITAMSAARWGPYTGKRKVLVPNKPIDCSECVNGGPCACMASIAVSEAYSAASSLLSGNDVYHEGVSVHG